MNFVLIRVDESGKLIGFGQGKSGKSQGILNSRSCDIHDSFKNTAKGVFLKEFLDQD